MKDKKGNNIFRGDVVIVDVPAKHYDPTDPKLRSLPYRFTGVVRKVSTYRNGYMVGGSIEVVMPPVNNVLEIAETVRESRNVLKLSNEAAMLWKLENE